MIDLDTLFNFVLVLVFVLIGGVFAATEIALVSLRESQIRGIDDQGGRGSRVASVARNPNRFLAAVQIGVTVAGFFSAAYGASNIAPDVAPYLIGWGMAEGVADVVSLVVLTLIIAYLSLILGELVPKRLALQNSVGVAMATAPVLDRFAVLMRPVIWFLSISTNALVRLLGGDPSANQEEVSEEELRDIVASHEGLDPNERKILGDVFAARSSTLAEVMRPRPEVEFVSRELTLGEAAALVATKSYSRYPVIDGDFDDVIGFLHVRDLLGIPDDDPRRVGDVAREILNLPGTNPVLPTVALMRQRQIHIAVIVDEYGGTDGIVTLEDLVEEIVGEINDEYDPAEPAPTWGDQRVVTASGGLTLEDFADETGVHLPDGDYETVAGYLLAQLGRIPRVGDTGTAPDGATLQVSAMDRLRITEVTLTRAEEPATAVE